MTDGVSDTAELLHVAESRAAQHDQSITATGNASLSCTNRKGQPVHSDSANLLLALHFANLAISACQQSAQLLSLALPLPPVLFSTSCSHFRTA